MFLFTKARFRGSGYGGDDDNDDPKRNRKDSNKKNSDQPRRNPDDNDDDDNHGDDGEDDDEDNDSRPPSIDRYQLLLGNNTQWSPTKTSSKKPGAKLPSLHSRQLYWSGERAKLRPFIQR